MKKTLLALLILANSAFADCEDYLLYGSNLKAMLKIARGFGYASLKKDEHGDPEIHARVQGKPYKVVFYDCNEERDCNEVVFLAEYPLAVFNDTELVNEWNRANRYGTAYIDREKNSLNLAMSLNLNGGISDENFDNNLDVWKNVVGEFQIFLSSKDLGREGWQEELPIENPPLEKDTEKKSEPKPERAEEVKKEEPKIEEKLEEKKEEK